MKMRNKTDYLKRRHQRIRRRIKGDAQRPRMCVRVTGRHIYIQLIDDATATSLMAVSTLQAEKRPPLNVATAAALGQKAAATALAQGVREVVFDRGGHKYNGRVKAVAEAARAAGIKL